MPTTDAVSLSSGLAGVQATLAEHGPRFDRMEGSFIRLEGSFNRLEDKLDVFSSHIDTKIDYVYPELAALKEHVRHHDSQLIWLWRLLLAAAVGLVGLIGDAVWAGLIHFGSGK